MKMTTLSAPAAPPAFPIHSETASDAQIAEMNRQHKAKKEEFILFHNADTALRNLLVAAVPPIFFADQGDPMTIFGNKTVLQLLTYLHTTFDSISKKELEQNTDRMQLQWNPPTAIEALFIQLENGVSFATVGQDAPTKPTVLCWACNNIEQTGRFDIACREWRQMDPSAKIWPLFKRHFKAADKDLRRLDTTGTAGYHGSAHWVQTTSTLLTTTQAALAASELALARALAQVSLSSGSSAASDANISAITPATSGGQPRGYCWTVATRVQHATTPEMVPKQTQRPRTPWEATQTILSLVFNDENSEQEGQQHMRIRLIT
jgi:hypothetical protein